MKSSIKIFKLFSKPSFSETPFFMEELFPVAKLFFRKEILTAAFSLMVSLFALESLTAQSGMQIVIPSKIYVGEKVEIQYAFHKENFGLENDDNFCFESAVPLFLKYENLLTLEDASLTHNGSEHTLYLTLYCWEEGEIVFDAFSIGDAEIMLSPIKVFSILEKTKTDVLKPALSPMIIPGTTWIVYAFIIAAILLVATIIILLKKIDSVSQYIRNLSKLHFYKKNARRTIRKMKRLYASPVSDVNFCAITQGIFRDYLGCRFSFSFFSETTNSLPSVFEKLLGGNVSEVESKLIGSLVEIFNRCDFVRFGSQSEGGGKLEDNERAEIFGKAMKIISGFESPVPENNAEEGGENA